MTAPASPVAARRPVLVLNCGSSSVKFALFDAAAASAATGPREALSRGKVHGIGGARVRLDEAGSPPCDLALDSAQPYRSALHAIRQRVAARLEGSALLAVAHRVVHGGNQYFAPVRLDAGVLRALKALIPLAPLHQPFALESAQILLEEQPDLPQVACFDTAFHHSQARVEQLLPLPRSLWSQGLRRYGFHGLSYEYMAAVLPQRHGARARGRVIVAHLGSGASLCAMRELRSVASTMGFSALEGLMMGTRSGSMDPGVLLHLMEQHHMDAPALSRLLYQESGLLGVSGISPEIPVLLEREAQSGEEGAGEGGAARDALALYVRRVVREIGALTAVLGGLDLLVFTAGVGENSAEMRRRICADLGFLGIALDAQANARHAAVISSPHSGVPVGVEPTNEEWVAARHALECLA